MCPAAAPAAFRPCASVAPAASAAAFLAAPASSTPIGSLDCLADDARADEDLGQRAGELLAPRRRDEPRALADHLARVRGAADARHAVGAERVAQQRRVGARAVGRDEALGQRDDRRAAPEAARGQRRDHLVEAARRDAEEDEVGTYPAPTGTKPADVSPVRRRG